MSDIQQKNRRFHDFVMEQIQRRQWIDKGLENEWIQKATFDLRIDPIDARSLILGAAASRQIFIESEVERILDDLVTAFAGRSSKLSRQSFRQLADAAKTFSRGVLEEKDAEQMVKNAIARTGVRPRGQGLLKSKRWFRTVGVAQAKA